MQVLSLGPLDRIEVDKKSLSTILERCGQSKVAVISITGQGRQGKSFLLNFIKQYCTSSWNDSQDWMRDIDQESCFKFSSGYEAVTNGLVMWSHPIFVTIQEERVALLLVDCQGLFDTQTTRRGNKILCTLCTLMSSLLLLNIRSPFNESHLEYFTEMFDFGQSMMAEDRGNPFQELVLVFRDSTLGDEETDGWVQGNHWLMNHFLRETDNIPEANQKNRQKLMACYPSLKVYSFPSPAPKTVTKQSFKGSLAELTAKGNDFKEAIQVFVSRLPEITQVKTMDGEVMTGGKFFLNLHRIVHLLNENSEFTAAELKAAFDYSKVVDRIQLFHKNLELDLNGKSEVFSTIADSMTSIELSQKIDETLTQVKNDYILSFMEEALCERVHEVSYCSMSGSPVFVFEELIKNQIKSVKEDTAFLILSKKENEKINAKIDENNRKNEARIAEIKMSNETKQKEIQAQAEKNRLENERKIQELGEGFSLEKERLRAAGEQSQQDFQVKMKQLEQDKEEKIGQQQERSQHLEKQLNLLRQQIEEERKKEDERRELEKQRHEQQMNALRNQKRGICVVS